MTPPAKRRPRAGRERLDVDERRRQLVAIGLDLFSTRAYEDVSIDELARAAGISKGLLYHYFPTKRDFYVATVREAAGHLLSLTATDPRLPLIERLQRGVAVYLDYVAAHGLAYVALLRSAAGVDPDISAAVNSTREAFCKRLFDGTPAAESYEAGRPLLRAALRGWVAFVEAATLEWVEAKDIDREALGALLIELFLQSIALAVPSQRAALAIVR